MKEQAELTWQTLSGGHWHAMAIKGIHLCSLMMAILLLALTNPTKAESLPKAEDGYLYYCTGGRADSFLERPNAFILFKLQKDEVRDDKKADFYALLTMWMSGLLSSASSRKVM